MGSISLPVFLDHYHNHLLTDMKSPVKIFLPVAGFNHLDVGDKIVDVKGIANKKSSILSETESLQEPVFGEKDDEDSDDENADILFDRMDELDLKRISSFAWKVL